VEDFEGEVGLGARVGVLCSLFRLTRRSGLPSSSARLQDEVENGWVNCVAAHRGLGIDGFDRLVYSLLANRRPVVERLILRVGVVGVAAFVVVQPAAGRDFFPLTSSLLHFEIDAGWSSSLRELRRPRPL